MRRARRSSTTASTAPYESTRALANNSSGASASNFDRWMRYSRAPPPPPSAAHFLLRAARRRRRRGTFLVVVIFCNTRGSRGMRRRPLKSMSDAAGAGRMRQLSTGGPGVSWARVGRRLSYGFLARKCLNTPDPETQPSPRKSPDHGSRTSTTSTRRPSTSSARSAATTRMPAIMWMSCTRVLPGSEKWPARPNGSCGPVVLRRLLAERLCLRWAEGEARRNARALQGEEHGRRAVRARGVPGDLRDVSLVINTTTTLDTRVPRAVGSAPSAAAR